MNILFLSLSKIRNIDAHGIYTDLMREFAKNEHEVYIVSPTEKREAEDTMIIKSDIRDWHQNVHVLCLRTGNITATRNLIEKGVSTLEIEWKITRGVKKYFADVKFDLVLYTTPPITLVKPIKFIKKRDGAKSYLMLKDIFPQNAVDLGMMSKIGLKGLLYKHFRKKEKKLYSISDRIGCMSLANVQYVLKNNREISSEKVELCPNAIEIQNMTITDEERINIRSKYNIPLDKKVFVYGGNLGKPQDIPFVIECINACKNIENAFFLIVGNGAEYERLESFVSKSKPVNMMLMQSLPKVDYEKMISACDVGLIFLDHRFTIPNYPSRLLSYMQAKLPVLACTDSNTDVGKVICSGKFGWWCESNNPKIFAKIINEACESNLDVKGDYAYQVLKDNYDVYMVYKKIVSVLIN